MLANLACQIDLPQVGDEAGDSAERRYGTLGLPQDQPFVRQSRLDFVGD